MEAKRKRGRNVLNENLQQTYPYIKKTKSESDVRCDTCNAEFSISHGGKSDIESHIKSARHKKSNTAASGSKSVSNFFMSSNMTKADMHIAACEGIWAYHVICSNHSFRSADCSSKIIRNCFELVKFSCARTKCEAIATAVFAPYAHAILEKELAECLHVSVLTDASNHGHIKMFPVVIRYFLENAGVRLKIINLTSESDEKAKTIVRVVNDAMEKYKVKEKAAGFGADNAPGNFGSRVRGGEENAFRQLKALYPGLIGVGCGAHIVHNTLKRGCDRMPIDVESIVCKIYSHFYIFTVRVTHLKEFCEQVGIEYQKLLGLTKTRFLALLPAIDSILRVYEGLEEYFENDLSSPVVLKTFFRDPMAKIWLLFLRDQVCIRCFLSLNVRQSNFI